MPVPVNTISGGRLFRVHGCRFQVTHTRLDEGNKGTTDYTFTQPNFNIGQFRSNMVMLWEYIPGSTFFLVWTTGDEWCLYDTANGSANRYSFDFNQQAHNIFLMKYNLSFQTLEGF